MTKHCCRCEQHKPATDFNRDKRRKDGLRSYCRACEKAGKESAGYDLEKYNGVSLAKWLLNKSGV